ncbi:hypothetical protein GCM10022222_64160 [Amycolatopsis ultiminotia]|uniref:SnoaL-like domain-containing protein n=1 Tax=Amycolatopsis ultiminotia TaxID=543629 RepID=A0ABP6XT30_9PSEU
MTTNLESDQAAVNAVPVQIVAAWAEQDSDAFARTFTPDGTMILPGVHRKGQDEIPAYMTTAIAGTLAHTRVTGAPIDLRFLTPDSAPVITKGGVLAPGERAIRAAWVVVRRTAAQPESTLEAATAHEQYSQVRIPVPLHSSFNGDQR